MRGRASKVSFFVPPVPGLVNKGQVFYSNEAKPIVNYPNLDYTVVHLYAYNNCIKYLKVFFLGVTIAV